MRWGGKEAGFDGGVVEIGVCDTHRIAAFCKYAPECKRKTRFLTNYKNLKRKRRFEIPLESDLKGH